jgi:hypothetical protein
MVETFIERTAYFQSIEHKQYIVDSSKRLMKTRILPAKKKNRETRILPIAY